MTPDSDMAEDVLSMASSAADIQRWLIQIAINGKASGDKRADIIHAAGRIARLAEGLR